MNINERIAVIVSRPPFLEPTADKGMVSEASIKQLIKDVLAEVMPEKISDNPLSASPEHRFYHDQVIDEMEAKIEELGL